MRQTMGVTYNPKKRARAKVHGFRARMSTANAILWSFLLFTVLLSGYHWNRI